MPNLIATVSERAWQRARDMHAAGKSWAAIAEDTGISSERLRRYFNPDFRDRRAAVARALRAGNPGAGVVTRMPLADVARVLAVIPTDTRDTTARLCGDPLPGRSALDRARAGI